jgi:Cytochrome c7 and related cytochrome c/Class III cytochrome C family
MTEKVRNATFILAFIFGAVFCASAKTAPQSPAVKQMVPDNPSEHTPPVQPIPYSHKKHLSFGLQCKDCHTNPDPGRLMTFPATSKCMQCHVTIAKDKPAIQKLAGFAKSQKPIPWVRVYQVLPGVAWNHRAHLEAGIKCEICHGQVAQMEAMSEVTSVVTMYSCLHCHEMNNAKTACVTCHKN